MKGTVKLALLVAALLGGSWAFAFQTPASATVAKKLADPIKNSTGGTIGWKCVADCGSGGEACCCSGSECEE